LRLAHIALAEQADIDWQRLHRFQHAVYGPWAGRHRGGQRTDGRAGAAAHQRRRSGCKRLLGLLRRDEMDVGINRSGGEDLAFTGGRIRGAADTDVYARLDIRVAGLADTGDTSVLDADIGFDNAPMIKDDHIRDDHVRDLGSVALPLPHSVTDDRAAAEGD